MSTPQQQQNDFETLNYAQIASRLSDERPNNADPRDGYALVNVLDHDSYAEGHIPASINIPKGNEEEFTTRYSRDKEIVLYCASPDCDASPTVAKKLASMGFSNVYDYEAGMTDWKQNGNTVETGPA